MATTTLKGFPAHKLDDARDALAKAFARLVRAAAKAGASAPAAPELRATRQFVQSKCTLCTGVFDGVPPDLHFCMPLGTQTHGCMWKTMELVDLEIIAERPALAGWDFLACVEPLEGGNLLRQVPGAVVADGELEGWRNGDLRCDHCNTIRRRTETFIVRADGSDVSIPAGTYKQVGRNCLEAFLGGKSAATVVAMLGWPEVVRGAAGDEDEGGGWFERAPQVFDPIEFLGWVCGVIREDGWISRTAARADADDFGNGRFRTPTADAALRLVSPAMPGDRHYAKDRERCAPGAEGLERAAAALAWARALMPTSDYERNLVLVASQQLMRRDHAGILASVIPAHTRALGREMERRSRAATPSAHVGTIGGKLALDLLVDKVVELASDWGASNLITMRDVSGNAFIWRTGASAKPGDRLRLRGTVKKHSEFRDVKQTELTRCTITERLTGAATGFDATPSAPPSLKPERKPRVKKATQAAREWQVGDEVSFATYPNRYSSIQVDSGKIERIEQGERALIVYVRLSSGQLAGVSPSYLHTPNSHTVDAAGQIVWQEEKIAS